jgi:hypothetical protein
LSSIKSSREACGGSCDGDAGVVLCGPARDFLAVDCHRWLPQNLTSIGAPVIYNVTGNLLAAYVDSTGAPGFQTGAGGDRQLDQLDHGLNANDER